MKKKANKFSWKKAFARAVLLGLAGLALFFAAVYYGLTGPLPTTAEIKTINHEMASVMYSTDGQIIGKIFAENRTRADSSEIPTHVIQALVATEDKRFFEHQGVDYTSYVRVAIKSIILRQNAGGGSTITQQLVKNLYGRKDLGLLSMPVSKLREAIVAQRFEAVYSKHQLVVLYLNTVPFGENTWGIEAAARRYFNKEVSELSTPQAALLIGMLKANTAFNPRLYPERAMTRRNVVLALMMEQGFITNAEYDDARSSPLNLDYTNYSLYNPAGHFAYQVEKRARAILADVAQQSGVAYDVEKDGLTIETTLRYSLQELAIDAIKKHLTTRQSQLEHELRNSSTMRKFYRQHAALQADTSVQIRQLFTWAEEQKAFSRLDSAWQYEQTLHASFLALDPATGEILAWVGGNNYRYLPYDLVTAKRQAASTFKPIVYAAALERGFTPCDYFNNDSVTYTSFDNWSPQNYDRSSGGEVAMWYALAKSMNIPTADVYFGAGHEQVLKTAGALGIALPEQEQPSIALGAASVSLYELTRAYGAMAHSGYLEETQFIRTITNKHGDIIYQNEDVPSRKALSDSTVKALTTMLRRAVEDGTGKSLASTYGVSASLAGKTGTSQNYSDAWFMSYNPKMVCGVWVGAMNPSIHFKTGGRGSGSRLALPIAGHFYKSVEKQNGLRRTYLVGFATPLDSAECPGIKPESKVGNWVDNILTKDGKEPKRKEPKKPKKEGFFKKTFKKIFKRKKEG